MSRRRPPATRALARLKLTGKIAGIDTVIDATGTGNLSNPGAAALQVTGRFDAEDGRVLAGFTGIDQLANMERRPARLTLEADGALDRAFRVDAKFAGSEVSATATGTLRGATDGRLDVSLRAADAKLPRRTATVPVDLRGKLALEKTGLKLDDLAGRVAGTNVKGRLTVALGAVPRVEGRIEADQVDGAELVAILAGAPVAGAKPTWSTEPFTAPALPVATGRLEFRAGSVQWAPGLVARDLSGAVLASEGAFALDGVTGKLGDGRLELGGRLRRGAGGVSIGSHVKLVNADLGAVLAATHAPAAGRLSLDAEVQGQGLSAASLVGGLSGGGIMTLENVEIAGLDPAAINAAISAVDRGLAINAGRIAEIVNASLNSGRLRVPFATAPITIAEGRVRVSDLEAPAQSADVDAMATFGLVDHQVDMRFMLTGAQRKDAPGGERPSLAVTREGAARQRAPQRRCRHAGQLAHRACGRAGDEAPRGSRAPAQAAGIARTPAAGCHGCAVRVGSGHRDAGPCSRPSGADRDQAAARGAACPVIPSGIAASARAAGAATAVGFLPAEHPLKRDGATPGGGAQVGSVPAFRVADRIRRSRLQNQVAP